MYCVSCLHINLWRNSLQDGRSVLITIRWKVSVDRLNINIYSKPCLQGTLMKGHPLIRESFLKTVPGWTRKDGSRPPPWVPLLKGIGILSTSLGSKTLNTSLDLGGTKIKDPVVGATWPRYFAPPAMCLQA